MPFSASTCITNPGTTPLGPILSAYTDTDTYLNPFSSVLTTQITGSSCPYVFTDIPDGATNIRLIDPSNGCCITIPIQSSDFCNTCDLGFTVYSSVTNSQIVAGNLTGSCQANISDYVIHWTGPNGSANIAYTSGQGSVFSSLYTFTHPLTGSSAIFSQQGTYVPVIDRVIISGITFSNTGGTGTYDTTLDCFSGVQVNPLTCDNGNTPLSAYTHSYYFSGTGASAVPLNVTFQLSANTKYFAYSFTGQSVPDTLKIIYSGSNITPNQLLLENVSIGANNSVNSVLWSSSPRTIKVTNFQRVLCLTGIPYSNGANLSIQITPNPGNTEWALNMRCLSSFDCTSCPTTNYRNSPQKIVKSTITAITDTNNCFTNVQFGVSACTTSQAFATDLYKYYSTKYNSSGVPFFSNGFTASVLDNPVSIPGLSYIKGNNITDQLTYTSSQCQNINAGNPSVSNFACRTSPPSGIIYFTKSVVGGLGRIVIESTNSEHISHYLSSYYSTANNTSPGWFYSACTNIPYPGATGTPPIQGPFTGGTFTGATISTTNPYDPRYYRGFILALPTATGNTTCNGNSSEGGGTGFIGNLPGGLWQIYKFHTSSPVITGTVGSNYYLQITMNTGTTLINYPICAINCNTRVREVINSINDSSTATTNNLSFTSNTASMAAEPFKTTYYSENCTPITARTYDNFMRTYPYSEITMPTKLTDNSLVPSYSGIVCNFPLYNFPTITSQLDVENNLYTFNCRTVLLPTGLKDFEIYCSTISNWSASTTQTLAYRYSANTEWFCNPTFIAGC